METLKFVMITTHYPPHHIGGDAVMVQNLSEELTTRGHEIHIVYCPDVFDLVSRRNLDRPTDSDRTGYNTPNTHAIHSRFPSMATMKTHTLGASGHMEDVIHRIVSEIKPDVVHWHNTKAFVPTPFSYGRASNVYTAHDFFSVCPKSSLIKPGGSVCARPSLCQFCLIASGKLPQVWRAGRRRVLRIPPDFKIVSPSEFLAEMLSSHGFRDPHVVPNFVPDPGAAILENRGERDSVVFIGILERHKGPQVLLDAFSMSADEHDMTLEIIGEGSLRGGLTKRAVRLGVEDRVKIPGRITRNDIMTIMGRAKVMVVPSIWYENCPLSALEALSFGVPIIASNIGGLPEIATQPAGSATFTPGSINELSRELTNVHEDLGGQRQRMLMARKSYEEKYCPRRHVDMYMRLLSQE